LATSSDEVNSDDSEVVVNMEEQHGIQRMQQTKNFDVYQGTAKIQPTASSSSSSSSSSSARGLHKLSESSYHNDEERGNIGFHRLHSTSGEFALRRDSKESLINRGSSGSQTSATMNAKENTYGSSYYSIHGGASGGPGSGGGQGGSKSDVKTNTHEKMRKKTRQKYQVSIR
jgi:hypothetical protein